MKIKKPTLLLNESVARSNIKRMADKARANNIDLIPHFKTHQSHIVGDWFKEEGVSAITVSSVSMAQYFADSGWQKITIAFPVNILEINEIAELSSRVELYLLITELEQVHELINKVPLFTNILIEIDPGYHRSGIEANEGLKITEMIAAIKKSQHHFQGFYSHFGHTYQAKSKEEVKAIFNKSLNILCDLKIKFADAQPSISIGDTPSASIVEDFHRVDYLHAGNFVFYDLTQAQLGSCREEDIAIALACPVVSKNDQRQEIIIYGGGIHFSKESYFNNDLDKTIFGKVVTISGSGWSASLAGCYVKSISQEHGVVHLSAKAYSQISVGDLIGVLPVHSCMTADCMGAYVTLSSEEIDHFKYECTR